MLKSMQKGVVEKTHYNADDECW